MARSSPELELVIPTLDAGRAFGTTLLRVSGQTAGPVTVLVLDSGSQDATRHIVNQFPAARFVDADEPPGPRAWNRCMEEAGGEVVVFLSQDAVPVDDGWLARLTAPLANPSVAAAYGAQRLPAGAPALDAFRTGRRFPPAAHERRARFGDSVSLDSIGFAIENSAIRRSAWNGIRFNEHLPIAADREWARQVLFASYTVVYVPDAVVERSTHGRLKKTFREALLSGWTAVFLGADAGTLSPRDDRFVRSAAWHLLRRGHLHELPQLALHDAAHRYGYWLGRRLHRLAPSLRQRIAPEVAAEHPRRELRELERAA